MESTRLSRYAKNCMILNIHCCISCVLLTVAVSTGGVAVVLHISIVSAPSMTVTAILPVLTISTILFVCATRCKLDIFKFVQCKRKF